MISVIEIRDGDEDAYLTPERVQMDRQARSEILLNMAGALLLVSIIFLLFILMSVRSTKITPTNVTDPTFDYINISTFVLEIVSRKDWKAQESRHVHKNLTLPVHRILVGHTGFNECREFDMCTQEILKLQIFYMEHKHVDDIGWNFMIDANGTVYEGCGWNYEGFHTSGYNTDSIGIAFIGNFSKNSPSQEHFIALHLLIEEGRRLEKIAQDYKLYAHRAFLPLTDSPGKNVINVIKNWPHFKYH